MGGERGTGRKARQRGKRGAAARHGGHGPSKEQQMRWRRPHRSHPIQPSHSRRARTYAGRTAARHGGPPGGKIEARQRGKREARRRGAARRKGGCCGCGALIVATRSSPALPQPTRPDLCGAHDNAASGRA
jgi:hypothetical protein